MKSIDVLLTELRQLDINLWVENDRLRYRATKEAITAEILIEMKERKEEILSFLQEATGTVRTEHSSISPVSRDVDLPLSVAQQRIWLQSQLEPDSPINNMPYAYRFQGSLNVAVLEQSLNEIIRRHEILRTTYPTVNGQPILEIAPELALSLAIIDLIEVPPNERETHAQLLANEEVKRPFVLDQGPLLRLLLLRLGEEDHILIFNMHRIICDGSSCDIFFRELISFYLAFCTNQSTALLPLPIQYTDFAYWQRQWLQGEVLESQFNYWKQKLSGNVPSLQLPTDYPRPSLLTYKGSRCGRVLPKSLNEALNVLSQQSGCTLFMTLLAAFRLLLYCYTKQEDSIISYSAAGRGQVETEGLIGPLSNTLVMRTHLSESLRFLDLLDQVRELALDADAHQNLPFEKLIPEVQWEKDRGRSPLFQVLFALNPPWTGEKGLSVIDLPGLTITSLFGYVYIGQTKFDLTLVMRETNTGLRAIIEYNADIFQESSVINMLDDLETILESIVIKPEAEINTLAVTPSKVNHHALLTSELVRLRPEVTYVPPQSKLEHQLIQIWEQLFGMHPISIRDNFFAIGGHSLLAVRLFAQIEEIFETKLPLSAIFQAPTIEELALVLQSKVEIPSWYSLVPLQPKGSRPPLFGIHFLEFKNLSRYLGADQPVYGLRYGMGELKTNRMLTLPKVEDLATHFIEEMRSFQPEGPYFLIGHSFGGLVALEMAQQLVAQGLQIGLLAVVDTYIEAVTEEIPLSLTEKLSNLKRLGYPEFLKRVKKQFRHLRSQYYSLNYTSEELKTRYLPHDHTLDSLSTLRRAYTPKSYSGQVILFQSIHRSVTYRVEAPEVGWRNFLDGELIIHEVPGDHSSLLEDPHVQILAENLKTYLDS